MTRQSLLKVDNLTVCFGVPGHRIPVVDDVSFEVAPGETLALVGESGSGKTITAKATMGLLPSKAMITGGSAVLSLGNQQTNLLAMSDAEMRQLRGAKISMIFQEPMSALSPLHTVGAQVAEVLRVHTSLSSAEIKRRVLDLFEEVGFPRPERAWSAYPFELSGGLRQRAVIAMAMIADPKLVIADEPTTALDVTTQAMVLDLMKQLQREHDTAVVLITHDLGVVANMADQVVVMRRGEVVEKGDARDVLSTPGHGYTKALIAAAPKVPHELCEYAPPGPDHILTVENLSKTYPGRSRSFGPDDPPVRAVTDFDMVLERGKTVAVVGESGSGKSTAAKLILRAERPDPGAEIMFRSRDGEKQNVADLSGDALYAFRRSAQMVFQDPYASLSPRMSIQDILTEPLKIHGIGTRSERRDKAAYLMSRVGLSTDHLARFPYAFSGGQRQRIAIARALALDPELLVCDEPTSALDVSVQAEVLELLAELRSEMGLSYLFISHDLAVVSKLADRVMVMRRGHVIEEGATDCVFADPRHPYTKALMAASPEADMDRRLDLAAVAAGAGDPETWAAPYGFSGDNAPDLVEVSPGHLVRAAA
ncbi:ABC transporter ATP-binding protein [Rhodobacteraceae bacterium NNCM2]|nr:ABC transporter ATP-binding protein [Coraliihabitans acroporae]